MDNLQEHSISDNENHKIRALAKLGSEFLKIEPDYDAEDVVEHIDKFVFEHQQSIESVDLIENVSLQLGSLWGETLRQHFEWEWGTLVFSDHDIEALAILSPTRSVIIYPVHFIRDSLSNENIDPTILLSFNMLDSGSASGLAPNSYINLMNSVKRIIPRPRF